MRAAVDRRVLLVVGVVALALVGAAAVVVARGFGPSCGVAVDELSGAATELVPVADLSPAGTVGEGRRPVIDAVDGLGLGSVVSGRFFDSGVPSLVPLGGDRTALATPRTVRVVTVPEGDVEWGRSFGANAAAGGLVGDRFVTLVGGDEPTVVSLEPGSGDLSSCVAAPAARGDATTLLTDQAGTDVVVAVGAPASPVTLSRVDPSGSVAWQRTMDGPGEAGSVTVLGSTVVVGRLGTDPVRRAEMAVAGGIAAPTVTAYSLADGAPTWSYPTDFDSTAAGVVGEVGGLLLVLTSSPGSRRADSAPADSRTAANRLVALDGSGAEVWSVALGSGYWSASLWGPVVVVQGADPRGGAQLRAYSVESGSPTWRVRSAQAPAVGPDPRLNFGAAVALGPVYAVPSPNGLLLVEPGSGDVQRRDSEVAIERLVPVGDHVAVTTDEALLVVEVLD